ncbi:MAG: DUF1579 family protein [Planctomycetota bacterium]|nr:DUF1579 family protein [Planctomycetota bacterium]
MSNYRVRLLSGLVLPAALLVCAGAAHASIAGPENTSRASASSKSVASHPLMSRLLGEWEGSIQARVGERQNGSIGSMSIQKQPDGSMLMVFEGRVNGKQLEGGALFSLTGDGSALQATLFDSVSESVFRSKQQGQSDRSKATLAGDPESKNAKFEHVLRLVENDRFVFERFELDSEGRRSLVLALDVRRLTEGEKSAAASINQSRLLARIDSGAMTASVQE